MQRGDHTVRVTYEVVEGIKGVAGVVQPVDPSVEIADLVATHPRALAWRLSLRGATAVFFLCQPHEGSTYEEILSGHIERTTSRL